jgi:hypothetical protein
MSSAPDFIENDVSSPSLCRRPGNLTLFIVSEGQLRFVPQFMLGFCPRMLEKRANLEFKKTTGDCAEV